MESNGWVMWNMGTFNDPCICIIYTIWWFNSSPWKDPPIFKFGKPSISMGHLYHGYLSHNQRVYISVCIYIYIIHICRPLYDLPFLKYFNDLHLMHDWSFHTNHHLSIHILYPKFLVYITSWDLIASNIYQHVLQEHIKGYLVGKRTLKKEVDVYQHRNRDIRYLTKMGTVYLMR